MNNLLRGEVLKTFKKLHKTRQIVFQGDEYALNLTKKKINDEYKKYKHVTDEKSVEDLNKFALDVEQELRTTVVQAIEKKTGTFKLNVRQDHLVDNSTLPIGFLAKSYKKCSSKERKPTNGEL